MLSEFKTQKAGEGARKFGLPLRPRRVMSARLIAPAPKPLGDPEREKRWRDAAKAVEPLECTPAAAYLAGRAVLLDVAVRAHARFSHAFCGHPAVVFPIRDRQGQLVAIQGRFLDPKASPKAMSMGRIGDGVFFTDKLALTASPVVIAEAPIDALSLAAAPNALAAFGAVAHRAKPQGAKDWNELLVKCGADELRAQFIRCLPSDDPFAD